MSKPNPISPCRGEVWEVILESNTGSEPKKTQPAVVVSTDGLHRLSARLVVPITSWKDHFSELIWIVPIKPGADNGLAKIAAADATLTCSADVSNFSSRQGNLNAKLMQEITAAIAAVIEL